MKGRIILDILCILLFGLLAYIGIGKILDYKASASVKPETTSLEGELLPSFKLLLPDSTTYFDTKDISGKQPVVLFYFSPRCPYCHQQMEEICKSAERLKHIRFYIFTVYPFPEMKIFYEQYQLKNFPNIAMGIDNELFFGNHFKTKQVPYMAIYGRDKRLKGAFLGKLYSRQIKAVAEK